jgi:hypothetical protein
VNDPIHVVPREVMTLTYPELRAGAMWRRTVRHAINSARVLGADVRVAEKWGLLDSRFTIRAIGTDDELAPLMNLALLAAATRKETP